MSWQERRPENVASISFLEERINMYISAMDTASAVNDSHQSSQLQRDIQKLVDLMERVGAGEEIMESQVPPPLAITPQIDVLPNALGELSSRLADYHKALYFAEEELSEDRINKIQGLQRALQAIHNLQKRAEAGFPIRADEVPPPVAIPADEEFDNDAINTLTSRLAQYQEALKAAEQSKGTDRRRIAKINSTLRTLEFLMTRAKAKRPVWKKDIPPEFDYYNVSPKGSPSMNKTKYLLVLRSLILRLSAPTVSDSDIGETYGEAHQKLKTLEEELVNNRDAQPWLRSGNSLSELTKMVEKLERLAAKKKETVPNSSQNLALIETRILEYKTAALKAKKENQMSSAIKHFKVHKGLQALKVSVEKGEAVDMTLVPPSPRDYTPTLGDSAPPFFPQQSGDSKPGEERKPSQSETACLVPVNIRPTVETAEDKLAQKLSNYLDLSDNGVEGASSLEKSNLFINGTDLPKAKLLKKVQNSDVKMSSEKGLYGDPGFSDSKLPFDEKEPVERKHLEEAQAAEVTETGKQDTETSNAAVATNTEYASQETLRHSQNGIASSDGKDGLEGRVEQELPAAETYSSKTKESETKESSPKPSPKSSNDVYSRKTLDSVGFLSCQTVPLAAINAAASVSTHTSNSDQTNHVTSTGLGEISDHIPNSGANTPNNSQTDFLAEKSISGYSKPSSLKDTYLKDNGLIVRNGAQVDDQFVVEGTGEKVSGPQEINQATERHANILQPDRPTTTSDTVTELSASKLGFDDSHIPSQNTPHLSTSLNEESNATKEFETAHPALDHTGVIAEAVAVDALSVRSEQLVSPAEFKEQEQSIEHSDTDSLLHQASSKHINHLDESVVVKAVSSTSSTEELEFQDLMESMSVSSAYPNSLMTNEDKPSSISSEDVTKRLNSISGSVSNMPPLQKEQNINHAIEKHLHPSKTAVDRGLSNGTELGSQTLPSQQISSVFSPLPLEAGADTTVNSWSKMNAASNRANNQIAPHSEIVFTCLENLKYDLLIEKSKNTGANSKDIAKLETRMEEIKSKLKQSGRLIWELYKNCLESELISISKEIVALQGSNLEDRLCILQHKQIIANKELKFLQECLPKLSY